MFVTHNQDIRNSPTKMGNDFGNPMKECVITLQNKHILSSPYSLILFKIDKRLQLIGESFCLQRQISTLQTGSYTFYFSY